jgi:hypothetical protein
MPCTCMPCTSGVLVMQGPCCADVRQAHFLKNGDAQITQAVAGLSTQRRLLMSGQCLVASAWCHYHRIHSRADRADGNGTAHFEKSAAPSGGLLQQLPVTMAASCQLGALGASSARQLNTVSQHCCDACYLSMAECRNPHPERSVRVPCRV